MKRSFLQGLGLEKDVIDQIMAVHGDEVEVLTAQVSEAKTERDAAKAQAKAFEGLDVEALKRAPEDLKSEYEQKIKGMQIDQAIQKSLAEAKAKHPDLLFGQFDREKITVDENGAIVGIAEQTNALKETYKDQFGVEVSGAKPADPAPNGAGATFDFGWGPAKN